MPILRLTQSAVTPERFRVESSLEGDGLLRQTATAEFDFAITAQDREDFRWYLEDYLLHVADPAPKIAARIEGRIREIGAEVFKATFQTNHDARNLWAALRDHLQDTRVEIITGIHDATALPWELLRDPETDTSLALRAHAFVRAANNPTQSFHLREVEAGSIRILLVICRPGGSEDVPFRSVASRLIKALSESAREAFQLDVLRPPTFARLGEILRAARAAGKPYHVVHFDGHGIYEDLEAKYSNQPAKNRRGYLVFENPAYQEPTELVHGTLLGGVLSEADVPVLVLNACRSAHAEPPSAPEQARSESTTRLNPRNYEVHTKVRAFGSLAQEVVSVGVASVVAMRYNVYVVTAAQFVTDLYAALAGGQTLGEAVTLGRRQLEAQPLREIAYQPRPLQDWIVPVVYETTPVALFPKRTQKGELKITVSASVAAPASGDVAAELEKRPDAGFFGRDETLLALDRAFDTQAIVLLHAYAGSGKTSTAAEFGRWYHLTGGVTGPLLFTSFDRHKSLAQVLNEAIGRVFRNALEQSNVPWLTLSYEQRRDVALNIMAQNSMLWIWDNVEPIAGFPTGTQSEWSNAEQRTLADFLRAAKQTKTKFLLTSRRDEQDWLGDLPARVSVPSMPMQERVQLSQALAEKRGHQLTDVEDWAPLLRFTGGNPLTITVLVGQALHDNFKTKTEIEAFVARLRTGEDAFADEASEGRDKSLGASLSYGFKHAFSEDERKQLALLHFFQGFVNVDVLCEMGNPKADWCLAEVRGLTSEAGTHLLDRAAEVGLLTALGGGYYQIHPAIPWFFGGMFKQHYAGLSDSGEGQRLRAMRAFVGAAVDLANHYAHLYERGNREVLALLTNEEANLLHARQFARTHSWWPESIKAMEGLRTLYEHMGRRAEWMGLVNEILPDFVAPGTVGPLPGREEQWSKVTEYLTVFAMEQRDWRNAERLQRLRINWAREQAAPAIAGLPGKLDDTQRHAIRNLVAALSFLAEIQRSREEPDCVATYKEAILLATHIVDRHAAAVALFNLSQVYVQLRSLRDLSEAERLCQASLGLHEDSDRHGRAHCLGQLGLIARENFREAREANRPAGELLHYLNAAAQFYEQSLNLLPPNAADSLAVTHNQLASTYAELRNLDAALPHWSEAIEYLEAMPNIYDAGRTRINVANALADQGRFSDAREYAKAALLNFESLGDGAMVKIQEARKLIDRIEKDMQAKGGWFRNLFRS